MIRAADTDGSGTVEFNEFMELMADTMEVSQSRVNDFMELMADTIDSGPKVWFMRSFCQIVTNLIANK